MIVIIGGCGQMNTILFVFLKINYVRNIIVMPCQSEAE